MPGLARMSAGLTILVLLGLALLVLLARLRPVELLNRLIPSAGYRVRSFDYGADPLQRMDLYLPERASERPLVVFVYGGAWREGSRRDYRFIGQALCALGHPVLIPDYRRYPGVRFPDFIDDVANAIADLQQHAGDRLGQPLQRFILMGHSAGAHSAALLFTDPLWLRRAGVAVQPLALIGLAGPYDLPLDDPEVTPVFADRPPIEVNPVLQVRSGLPPVLLLHGAADGRVWPMHSWRFATRLREAGNPVRLRRYPRVGHVRVVAALAWPLRFIGRTHADVKRFLGSL